MRNPSARQWAREWRQMQERIQRRIEQLESEREELRIGAILRNKEIDGQISALRDVLHALKADAVEDKELTHV